MAGPTQEDEKSCSEKPGRQVKSYHVGQTTNSTYQRLPV
jgi:hypothetical protein